MKKIAGALPEAALNPGVAYNPPHLKSVQIHKSARGYF